MNNTTAGLTYALLIIPAIFSVVVIGQGVYKMKKQEKSGLITVILGVSFLLLIPVGYMMFIHV
jgi:hypothetical protein